MADAIDVAADALRAMSSCKGEYPGANACRARTRRRVVMPGYDGQRHFGVKVVTVHPGNAAHAKPGTRASYLLIDAGDGEPKLLCDGTALTALRTGAVSGLATRRLAGPTRAVLAYPVQAPRRVRKSKGSARCGRSRNPRRESGEVTRQCVRRLTRARFPQQPSIAQGRRGRIARAGRRHRDEFEQSGDRWPIGYVREATSTPSAHRARHVRLDPALLGGATVYVDQRAAALAEAGEISDAVRHGPDRSDALVELGAGTRRTRDEPIDEITLFKTVGHAALDLFTAVELLHRATRRMTRWISASGTARRGTARSAFHQVRDDLADHWGELEAMA